MPKKNNAEKKKEKKRDVTGLYTQLNSVELKNLISDDVRQHWRTLTVSH
jgi:hypothetical protein